MNNTLNLWKEEGHQIIPQNFEEFCKLVAQTGEFSRRGNYKMAAVYGQMAATHATGKSCGLFVSLELENILLEVGQKTVGNGFFRKNYSLDGSPQTILHVATSMKTIGGHSRMLWRWIQQDKERVHSLVLTRQAPTEVPKLLRDSVFNSGGRIHLLNTRIGSLISWAKRLRKIAATADLVVLHVNSSDIIPTLAFARKENSPPVIFLDHADHLFWVGVGVSDVFASLRESGSHLAQERRHIDPKRNIMLPVILEPTQRTLSRVEAKRQLGIPEDSILLLSIARAVKYRTIDGVSFADAHIPLLKQFNQAILMVIGPGQQEDWSSAIQQTQGRIQVFGETEHTEVYYQAADIYVDSFPFVSNTSLLEAGSYGVPLVSRYPYSSKSCGILGADMPGLTGNLVQVPDLKTYTTVLSHLVKDAEFRRSLGEATQRKIVETHQGAGWQDSLNHVYSQVSKMTRITIDKDTIDVMFLGEPDILMPHVHDIDITPDKLIEWHITLMPFGERLKYFFKLSQKKGFRNSPFNLLLPEWFRSHYYS